MPCLVEIHEEDQRHLRHALDLYLQTVPLDRYARTQVKELRSEISDASRNAGIVAVVPDNCPIEDLQFYSSTGSEISVAVVRAGNQAERTVVQTENDFSYVTRIMKNIRTDLVLGSLVNAIREATDQLASETGGDDHASDALDQIDAMMMALQDAKQRLEQIEDDPGKEAGGEPPRSPTPPRKGTRKSR